MLNQEYSRQINANRQSVMSLWMYSAGIMEYISEKLCHAYQLACCIMVKNDEIQRTKRRYDYISSKLLLLWKARKNIFYPYAKFYGSRSRESHNWFYCKRKFFFNPKIYYTRCMYIYSIFWWRFSFLLGWHEQFSFSKRTQYSIVHYLCFLKFVY